MTGLPAALSAFAFASTASVADSLIAAMRREMRFPPEGAADGLADSDETAVMTPSCQRRGARSDSPPESHVRDRARRRELHARPAVHGAPQALEQPLAVAEQDRDDGQVELVEQAGTQVL